MEHNKEVTIEDVNQSYKELYEAMDKLNETCDKINKNMDYWNTYWAKQNRNSK